MDNKDPNVVTLTKFQHVVNRVMTPDEARERCAEMDLNKEVTDYVVNQFNLDEDERDGDDGDGCDIAGDNGRRCYGMSWENAYSDLARACGVEEEKIDDCLAADDDEFPLVQRVWEAFFEE